MVGSLQSTFVLSTKRIPGADTLGEINGCLQLCYSIYAVGGGAGSIFSVELGGEGELRHFPISRVVNAVIIVL